MRSITQYAGPYPYIDGLIFQVTQRVDSIVVRHLKRAHGRSNYTLSRLLALWLNLLTNFSLVPLRLAVLGGAIIALLGGIGVIAVVLEALTSRSTPLGWASLMTAILVLSGVQSIMLGIVGE